MNVELKQVRTAAETALAATFADSKARLPGGPKTAGERERAFETFERRGLPNRRIEEWKYTDLRALMREAKPLAPAPDAQAKERAKHAGDLLHGVPMHRLVFADGVFVPELSDAVEFLAGVSIVPLADMLANNDAGAAFAAPEALRNDATLALNVALMTDGAVIRIARDTVVDKPIHLVFSHSGGAGTATYTRSQIVVETAAKVTLVETHEGADGTDYQVNTAVSLSVGERAEVSRIKVAREGSKALHVATLIANVGEGAILNDFTYTLGGAVTRNQLFVTCNGKGSRITLAGASLLRGKQHADVTLTVDHAVPSCTSREVFKSVLDDESRGVFQGKIVVRSDAQKTDARMMTRALLLSENAEADNKPELEIFADDVQCGHGATAGALDENLKFYLMARGIPEHEAESLLIQAFIGEAVETIADEGLRNALMFDTVRWLGARG
jgi:Fe-S cluster assembly protein SufD